MQITIQKTNENRRATLHLRGCVLGKLVGYEWAKDNSIRRIDTAMVSRWIDRLDSANDPSSTLDTIAAEAKKVLGEK